ncbi:hypothetical protein JZU48_05395, partial [bacterium]|nr:hypothetical protein [bacterium]
GPLSYTAIEGLSEQPVYRDLFLLGLTLFDVYSPDDSAASEYLPAFCEIDAILRVINRQQTESQPSAASKLWGVLRRATQ